MEWVVPPVHAPLMIVIAPASLAPSRPPKKPGSWPGSIARRRYSLPGTIASVESAARRQSRVHPSSCPLLRSAFPTPSPTAMPSIEEVFDDDTDLPLPADAPNRGTASSHYLRNTGTRGALLEEISDQDVDAMADAAGNYDLDMDRVAEQGRGFGDNIGRPVTSSATRSSASDIGAGPSSDLRPSGDRVGQQRPMGGIMGDFLQMQQAEEARMKKLEKQLGAGMIMKDQQEYKSQVSLLSGRLNAISQIPLAVGTRSIPCTLTQSFPPIKDVAYLDHKLSGGPKAYISPRPVRLSDCNAFTRYDTLSVCASLSHNLNVAFGYVIRQIEKTHPADWRNPGRVKVLIKKDNQYAHPIIQNRKSVGERAFESNRSAAGFFCWFVQEPSSAHKSPDRSRE